MTNDYPRLRIFFFGFTLFLIEILVFHLLEYLTFYLQSLLIISYALAGIGLAGLLAGRITWHDDRCFLICVAGTWFSLAISLISLLCFPSTPQGNLLLSSLFFFPGLYIAIAFRRYPSGRVYLADLSGAGLSVVALFALYALLKTEQILSLVFALLALAGLVASLRATPRKMMSSALFCLLVALSAAAVIWGVHSPRADLYYLARVKKKLPGLRTYRKDYRFVRSYDNLVSRIEVFHKPLSDRAYDLHVVFDSGIQQDEFQRTPLKFQDRDIRLIGGLHPDPRIFLIGSSAEGVVKTAKWLTRPEYIDGTEINPAITRMMQHDFLDESGHAYGGLSFAVGNSLAYLHDRSRTYDIITLMNCRSMRFPFLLGPPDHLHTTEAYGLYFRHLSDRGYLMFEERPLRRPGDLVIERQIATLYHTLRTMGQTDPARHLFIYDWQHDKSRSYEPFGGGSFTSILCKKTPLTRSDILAIQRWITIADKPYFEASAADKERSNVVYRWLPGVVESASHRKLFDALDRGPQQVDLHHPGFDLSPVTINRPYSSQVDLSYPETRSILVRMVFGALLFLLAVLITSRRIQHRKQHTRLVLCQMMIGSGYILVEILLMQLYHSWFISSSLAFIGTLSTLLISSGLGGQLFQTSERRLSITASLLGLLALHLLLIFGGIQRVGPYPLKILLILSTTAGTGLLMGYYFPLSVRRAREAGLADSIGVYFAVNSVSGALAVVGSLYLSVRFGFIATTACAGSLYLAAALLLKPWPADIAEQSASR